MVDVPPTVTMLGLGFGTCLGEPFRRLDMTLLFLTFLGAMFQPLMDLLAGLFGGLTGGGVT